MRKFLITVIVCVLGSMLFPDEAAAVWRRLYSQALSTDHQYMIIKDMAALNNRDLVPVFQEALQRLNTERGNIQNNTERVKQNDLLVLVIRELGHMKAADSSDELYQTLIDTDVSPFVQAEAIKALGDIGSLTYADKISQLLKNINTGSLVITDNQERETMVGACVYALERFGDARGFSPVFHAATSGAYSRKITERAARAMKNMVEDPTEHLKEIIQLETDFRVMSSVLKVADQSDAPPAQKVSVAQAALSRGMEIKTSGIREGNDAGQLRLKSLEMFKKYGITDLSAVSLIDDMLNANYSNTESLTALETLGTSASDEAATVINRFIEELNSKKQSGYTFANESLIRAAVQAMAASKNPAGKTSLREIEFSGWSGETRRLAREALAQMD